MPSNDIGTDRTLADDSVRSEAPGLDVTMTAGPVVAASSSVPTVPASLRTTVLPRIEVIGAESKIVADGKARYETSHRLGEGGVGEVLKARDNDIDRDVAIKKLRPEMQASGPALLRFAEEVRTVGRLEHPNIVPIHDVGVHPNGEYFFVMKYVQGETLESILEKLMAGDLKYHATYDNERRVEIMMGVLEALAYAHSKGIIHRDIKPANIMVGPYGEVMLMDWGLARALRGPETIEATPESPGSPDSPDVSGSRKLFRTRVGTLLGTPAYMSPEQARGEELDARSDIYSLCLTFYELFTLRHPLADEQELTSMLEAVKSKPVPAAVIQEHPAQGTVPADISWFLDRGLKKEKGDRYESIDAMIARLRARAGGDVPVQCPVTFSMRLLTLVRRGVAEYPYAGPSVFILGVLATIAFAIAGLMHVVAR